MRNEKRWERHLVTWIRRTLFFEHLARRDETAGRGLPKWDNVRPYIAKKKNNFVHFLLFKSEKSNIMLLPTFWNRRVHQICHFSFDIHAFLTAMKGSSAVCFLLNVLHSKCAIIISQELAVRSTGWNQIRSHLDVTDVPLHANQHHNRKLFSLVLLSIWFSPSLQFILIEHASMILFYWYMLK